MYVAIYLLPLIPMAASVIIKIISEKDSFKKIGYWKSQILLGIIFGIIAIIGTEKGVNIGDATVNVRDAAPLCAGLIFGGPAGIIAGIIGGVERWFAAYWGVGLYSQVACSVSTVVAGFVAAGIRKYICDDNMASPILGIGTAVTVEMFHCTLLFLTHIDNSEKAFYIAKICTVPMLIANCLAVFFAILLIHIIKRDMTLKEWYYHISPKIQISILICIVATFVLSAIFTYRLQTYNCEAEIDKTLTNTVERLNIQFEGIYDGTYNTDTKVRGMLSAITHESISDNCGYICVAYKYSKEFCVDHSKTQYADKRNLSEMGITQENLLIEHKTQKGVINGEDSFFQVEKTGDYIYVAVYPQKQVYTERDNVLLLNTYMYSLAFAVLFIVIYILIKRLILNNIKTLNKSLSMIIGGELNTRINITNTKEFDSLSNDINMTVDTLKKYIKEAEERIDKELLMARVIQRSSLPSVFPAYPECSDFDIYATMNAAKEVGGDFYDFYLLGKDKIAFAIADVSGKGIPAAMFMMVSKTLLKNQNEKRLGLDEAFNNTNKILCAENQAGLFITAWMGIMDRKTGEVEFVNAGHNPPLIYRKNEGYDYLEEEVNFVLAGYDVVRYKIQKTKLNPGDKLLIYTDGVTEATNIHEELYGEDRLKMFLNNHKSESVTETLDLLNKDVLEFTGENEQFDDITILEIEYKGN